MSSQTAYSELVKYTRRPSRLISTICGPPFSGVPAFGWPALRTIPPMCSEPVCLGLNGSETSYCSSWPVPQHDTYSCRSSSDKLMSVMNGGTAPKPLSIGGSSSGSAGSAGTSITLRIAHEPLSRYQTQIEAERSFRLVTAPEKPYSLFGS